MLLSSLKKWLPEIEVDAAMESLSFEGIFLDSRKVMKGSAFVALDGKNFSAQHFITDAEVKNAALVLSEKKLNTRLPNVVLPDLRKHLGLLSHVIWGKPSSELKTIGVTGTNGKTTTALLIQHLLTSHSFSSGYIGTLGYFYQGKKIEQDRTSPEAPELHEIASQMKNAGCKALALECSSHGIDLGRLNSLQLDTAVFTNLTQDHLDFHGDMKSYERSKKKLFTHLLSESQKTNKHSVLNIDDPVGLDWSKELNGNILGYGLNSQADLFAKDLRFESFGSFGVLVFKGKEYPFESPLVGKFNVYNVLAAFAASISVGLSIEACISGLKNFNGVPGRLQRVPHATRSVFVDYAHTPDALENVIQALRPLCKGELWTIFGCGGDRDRGKRPIMANVVSQKSDIAVMTADNPRTEDPNQIVNDMLDGVSIGQVRFELGDSQKVKGKRYCVELDRKKAIEAVLQLSKQEDIVLIAGKGHENYQEINHQKFPFDDFEIAAKYLKGLE